jgi:hypothetical protein
MGQRWLLRRCGVRSIICLADNGCHCTCPLEESLNPPVVACSSRYLQSWQGLTYRSDPQKQRHNDEIPEARQSGRWYRHGAVPNLG